MQFLRITLTVAVTATCIPVALGQTGQTPFARWDQLKRQTTVSSGEAAKTAEGGLEYFSPDFRAKPPAAAGSADVKRERLRVRTPDSRTASSAGSTSVMSQVKSRTPSSPESPFTQSSAAKKDGVTAAVFSSNHDLGGVQQTSSDFIAETSADAGENPFAEFLADDSDSPAESATPSAAADSTPFDSARPESAKSVVDAPQPEMPLLPASLEGPQTPSVTLQWVHHDEYSVGQECRCDLVLENTGRSIVRNVVAEAVLPKGLQVVSAEPAPMSAGGSARWGFSELSPGQTQKIELVVIPQQQGPVRMNAFVQLTGATASNVSVTEPVVAIRIEGPETVEVGQQVSYTVHVTNPGTGTAHNVLIQAAVPEGLEHRQGGLLTIEIGTLSPGELRRARLSLTAVKGGDQTLAVRVVADGGLNEQTEQMVAVAEPRLNIGLRGPETRNVGQPCDYEMVVVNEGSVDSNNVRAKYKVPAGFEFVRADSGGKFHPEDHTIEWFVGTLEPNRVRQLRVTLRPVQSGDSTHQVGVMSEHGGMTMAEHSMTVKGNAELTVRVAATRHQVQPGEEAVFQISIENSGSSGAESVGLSCELPPGLELLDIAGPSEFIADNGVVIFRSMPTLEPGKSAVFAMRTRCTRAGTHKVRARVASESISEPVIGEETTEGVIR